jgi:ribosomal protein L37AE/L43A
MANEQPLACGKCGQTTVHRSVDHVMTCNVCFPPTTKAQETTHTVIALIFALMVVGAFLYAASGGN